LFHGGLGFRAFVSWWLLPPQEVSLKAKVKLKKILWNLLGASEEFEGAH